MNNEEREHAMGEVPLVETLKEQIADSEDFREEGVANYLKKHHPAFTSPEEEEAERIAMEEQAHKERDESTD